MLLPLVSVIIPTYKNIEFLPNAIESVLNQTYENIEIIVVDDNNPESEFRKQTEELMKQYICISKIYYIQNAKNSERSATRNNGAKYSHGEYLMFLDNDDVFFCDKIKSQLEILRSKGEEYAIAYSKYVRCMNGRVVIHCGEKREGSLYIQALSRNLFIHPGSNLMIKREAFFEVGGFNEKLNINEDVDLLVRLLQRYKIAYCDILGLQVNIHKDLIRDYKYEECTKKYIDVEKTIIDSLPDEQRAKVLKMIGLQLYRFYLGSNANVKRISKEYHLSNKDKCKFLLYMIKRKLSRKAFSFDM